MSKFAKKKKTPSWHPFRPFPGYPHVGPLNEISDTPSTGTDEVARQHDIAYQKYLDQGGRPYTQFNDADQQFINNADNDIPGLVGKALFSVKKAMAPAYATPKSSGGYTNRRKEYEPDRVKPKRRLNFGEASPSDDWAVEDTMNDDTLDNGMALDTNRDGGGGGGSTNPGATQRSVERIPCVKNGGNTETFTFNNTYRVLLDNEANGTAPFRSAWPYGDALAAPYQDDGSTQFPKAYQFSTPWRIVPNNNLKNYITDNQWENMSCKGVVSYRVKNLSINLHGIYNMQRYSFSTSTIQGQDNAYIDIVEPNNSLWLNNTPPNMDSDHATQQPWCNGKATVFAQGDQFEAYSWLGTPPAPGSVNTLQTYNILLPFENPPTVDNLDAWYPDITRHEKHNLVRNGQTYNWNWSNNDSRFIAVNDPNLFNRSTVNFLDWAPIQLQNEAITSHLDYFTGHHEITGRPYGVGLDPDFGHRDNAIKPFLMKIPQLQQPNGESITHSCWLYLDYQCEIEVRYGGDSYMKNGYDKQKGRYSWFGNAHIDTMQRLGNPRGYNFTGQQSRTKQSGTNQLEGKSYQRIQEPRTGYSANLNSVYDVTLKPTTRTAADEAENVKNTKKNK